MNLSHLSYNSSRIQSTGIVGRISPKTWTAMEVFLASIATEEYESMASALIEMGATNKDVDVMAFAKDLEKIFSSIQVNTNTLNTHFLKFIGTALKRSLLR